MRAPPHVQRRARVLDDVLREAREALQRAHDRDPHRRLDAEQLLTRGGGRGT
jgi:hypothetical protein